MKKRIKAVACALVCALLATMFLTACAVSLTYSGKELPAASVGAQYSQSVATAEGADEIAYSLKEGSSLPAGLTLSGSGTVSGIPTAKSAAKSFVVVASAGGAEAEAEFSIAVGEGKLSYTGGTVSFVAGEESSASVATATGGVSVTYTLKEGSVLPEGLTLSAEGVISGTAAERNGDGVKVTIVASAKDCAPAEAEFTVKVGFPALVYEGGAIATGRVGEYYTANLRTAQGGSGVTYALQEGSELPAGLTLEGGLLVGVPEEAGSTTFSVVASAENYEDATAEFTVSMRGQTEQSAVAGTIEFGFTGTKELTSCYAGSEVYMDAVLSDDAAASNDNYVTFALAEDEEMPDGLTLYPNGTIAGTPEKKGSYTFTVVASAENCTPAEGKYKMIVNEAKIEYKAATLEEATVGTPYEGTVAFASTPDDTPITYALKEGSALPEGLTLSADGTISGTPQHYYERTYFYVVASAEGYTSTQATMYITIYDCVQPIVDGIMEAELIDLRGLTGAGWSGGATGSDMIQAFADASNAHAVGYTYTTGLVFNFVFESSAAVSDVELFIRVSTEIGDVTFAPDNLEIKLNGTVLNYTPMSMQGETNRVSPFREFSLGSGLSLAEGENVVSVSVLPNDLIGGGRMGGPIIDRIRVDTSASLSWQPFSFNLG